MENLANPVKSTGHYYYRYFSVVVDCAINSFFLNVIVYLGTML